jgi:hypothetical protein
MRLNTFALHKRGLSWEKEDLGVQDTEQGNLDPENVAGMPLSDMLLDSLNQASQLQEPCTGGCSPKCVKCRPEVQAVQI